jgi:curved DNA-binding protein CbpA
VAKTLYQLLEVPNTATPEAIKDAYVKIAARLRSSGASDRYAAVKQAYDILSEPASRARYDRQAYVVAEGPSTDDAGGRRWLPSWRGAAALLVVAAIGYYGWLYHKREQTRLELQKIQAEAQRQAEEAARDAERRERAEQASLADERRRAEQERAALERASNRDRGTALYRETLEHNQTARREQIQLQRDRDTVRREDAERRRIELEQQRRAEQEKRQLRELERTRPQRF